MKKYESQNKLMRRDLSPSTAAMMGSQRYITKRMSKYSHQLIQVNEYGGGKTTGGGVGKILQPSHHTRTGTGKKRCTSGIVSCRWRGHESATVFLVAAAELCRVSDTLEGGQYRKTDLPTMFFIGRGPQLCESKLLLRLSPMTKT